MSDRKQAASLKPNNLKPRKNLKNNKKGRLFVRLMLMNGVVIGAAMMVISIMLPQLISNHIYREKERELESQGKEMGRLMLDFTRNETDEETALYILDSMDRFLEARIWLVDKEGMVFLASEGRRGPRQQRRREKFLIPEPQQMEKILVGKTISTRQYLPHFGETMLTVGVPISDENIPHGNTNNMLTDNINEQPVTIEGALFLHTPVRGIYSTIIQLRRLTIIAGIAAIILASIPALFLSRRFSRPLINMKNAAFKMAGGEFSHQVPVTTNDELGQLGESLNHLATELDRHEKTRREFIENVSHELRTPVTAIRGFAESLLDGTASEPEAQKKYLKIISSEAERMGKLIGDILNLSRLDTGILEMNRAPFGLEEAVAAVVARMYPLTEQKSIHTDIKIPSGLPPVNGDREKIEQVLYILLDNAISFTPTKGTITIRAATPDVKNSKIKISIHDTGPGIPNEELSFIWERFYRVEKSRSRREGGTGLGLSIAREIIEAHGEKINAGNNSEGGAFFSFCLPKRSYNN